jgi:hypothetical protein
MSLQPVFAKVGELQVTLTINNVKTTNAPNIESKYFITYLI